MAQDVIITPADGEIEWQDNTTGVALIDIDANNNLSITNAGGNLSIGDGSSDVYIGNGIANVDLVFEQDGEIRGTGSQTLTLGTSGDTVQVGTGVDFLINGSLGIGTTPTAPLTIRSTTIPQVVMGYPTGTNEHRFYWDSSKVQLSADHNNNVSNSGMLFLIDGSTFLQGDSNGDVLVSNNLGVGGSPSKSLHVISSSTGEIARLQTTGSSTGGSWLGFRNSTLDLGYFGWGSTSNNNLYIVNWQNAPILFYTNGTEKMRIAANGSVGIGVDPSGSKLHIDNGVGNGSGVCLYVDGSGDIRSNSGGSLFFGAYDYAGSTYIRGYDSSAGLYFYADGVNRLQVSSDVNVQGASDLNINGSSRRLSFTSGTGTIRTTTSNKLFLQTNGTDALTIDTSQNVGIGTTSPSVKLEVNDDTTVSLANQPKIISEFTGTGTDGRNFISVTHEQSGTASALGAGVRFRTRVDTSGTAGYLNSYIFQGSPSQGHDMIYIAPKNMSFYVDGHDNDISGTTYTDYGTLALEIAESGNVGIGTTSPGTAKLYVLGGSSSQTFSTGADELVVEGSDHAGISILAAAAKRAQLYFNTDAFLRWVDNDGVLSIDTSSSSSKIAIAPSGASVGIGTSSPSYKLDVNGDAFATTLLSDYRRLRSYGNFSTSTNNTAGWYPLAAWGTSSGSRGGFIFYVSYTGGNHNPVTYVIKAFKNWSNDGALIVEKYGSNSLITDARIIADSSTVYHLELYLITQNTGHSFEVRYEALGYDSSGSSIVNFASTSLALSTNTGSVIASMNFGAGEGIAVHNALVQNNLHLGSAMYHHGDTDTYLGFNTNEAFLVAGSINGLHLYSTEAVVNENGANYNFRVEGDTVASLLVCDASADSVGIGTAVPQDKFHVRADGNASNGLRISNDSTGTSARTMLSMYNDSGSSSGFILSGSNYSAISGWANRLVINTDSLISNGIMVRPSTGGFKVSASGTHNNDFYVASSSSVGVGTDSPVRKFHVQGDAIINGGQGASTFNDLSIGGINGWSNGEAHRINFVYGNTGQTIFQTIESYFSNTAQGRSKLRFRNLYNNSGANTDISMTILGDGNVGIGSDQPSKKLHVEGDTLLEGTNSGTAATLSESATIYGLKVRGAASSGSLNFSSNNARYTLQALSSGNAAISLTLNPFGGNVGIGTTSPTDKLHVVGNLKIAGNINPTADVSYSIGTSSLRWLATYTARLLAGDGSASAPGITFINDTNTGLFRSANDYLNITVGGTEIVNFNSNGLNFVYNVNGATYQPLEGGAAAGRYWLMFDYTNNASYPFLTNRTPSGKVVIKTGVAAGGGENTHFTIEGGNGTVDAYFEDVNLGIGTTSPAELLHIQDSNTGRTGIAIDNTSTNGRNYILGSTGAVGSGADPGSFIIRDGDASSNRFVINSSGSVGIGTVSPGRHFAVTDLGQIKLTNNSTGNWAGIDLKTSGGTNDYTAYFGMLDSNGNFFIDVASNGDDVIIRQTGETHIGLQGNVGIGTTSTNAKLSIKGDTEFLDENTGVRIGLLYDNGTEGILDLRDNNVTKINLRTAGASYFTGGSVGIGTTSPDYELEVSTSSNSRIAATSVTNSVVNHLQADSSGAYVGPLSNHNLFIKTNNTTRVTVDTSGNVGIGTTSPYAKLQVNGSTQTFNAHFGQGQNNGSGNWGGISLGYSENNNLYRKVGIVAKAIGDSAARQELHFLVDSVNDAANATLTDSKMMIDINGNVGIGTTGPGSTRLRVVNGSSGQEIFKADDGATAVIRAKVDGTVTFEKGNVGIGIGSPSAILHLSDSDDQKIILSGSANPYIRFQSTTTNRAYIQWIESGSILGFFNQAGDNFDYFTHDSGAINLRLKGSDGDIWGSLYATDNSGNHQVGILDGDQHWAARHIKDTSWEFLTNNQSRMFINSTGVGIGTVSPSKKLHVNGEGYIDGKLTIGDNFSNVAGATDDHVLNIIVGSTSTPTLNSIKFHENTGGFGMAFGYDGTGSGDDNKLAWYNSSDGVMMTLSNGTSRGSELGINGNYTANRTLTINSISASERPAIKIVNPNFSTNTSSTGKTFYRWLPIDIDGTTRWIAIYS